MLIYFLFPLTVPQDTGIVTTATLCYLFSNHASAYFLFFVHILLLYFYNWYVFCLFVIVVFVINLMVDVFALLEMISVSARHDTSFFFQYCELWFCGRQTVFISGTSKQVSCFLFESNFLFCFVFLFVCFYKWSSNDFCLPDKFYGIDL